MMCFRETHHQKSKSHCLGRTWSTFDKKHVFRYEITRYIKSHILRHKANPFWTKGPKWISFISNFPNSQLWFQAEKLGIEIENQWKTPKSFKNWREVSPPPKTILDQNCSILVQKSLKFQKLARGLPPTKLDFDPNQPKMTSKIDKNGPFLSILDWSFKNWREVSPLFLLFLTKIMKISKILTGAWNCLPHFWIGNDEPGFLS